MSATVQARFSHLQGYVAAVEETLAALGEKERTMDLALAAFFQSNSEFGPSYSALPSDLRSWFTALRVTAVGVEATAAAFLAADEGMKWSPGWVPTDDFIERTRRSWLQEHAPDLALQASEAEHTGEQLVSKANQRAREIEQLRQSMQHSSITRVEWLSSEIRRLQAELDALEPEILLVLEQQAATLPQGGFPGGQVPASVLAAYELRRNLVGLITGQDTELARFVFVHLGRGAPPGDALKLAREDVAARQARQEAIDKAANLPQAESIEYYNIRGEVGLGVPGVDALVQGGGTLRVETMPDGRRFVTVGSFTGLGVSGGEGGGVRANWGETEVGAFAEAEAKAVLFVASGDHYEIPEGVSFDQFVRDNVVGGLDPADKIPDLPSIDWNFTPWGGELRTPGYDPSLWADPPDRTGTSFSIGVEGSVEAGGIVGIVGADFFGPMENMLGNAIGGEGSVSHQLTVNSYEHDNLQGYEYSMSGNVGAGATFVDIAKDADGNSLFGLDIEGNAQIDVSIEVVTDTTNNNIEEVRLNVGLGANDSYSMHGYTWDMDDPALQEVWDDFRTGDASLLDVIDATTGENTTNYDFESTTYGVEIDVTVFQGELEFERISMNEQ